MNRRFVASLMFVTAGILMVPAAGAASADVCLNPGDVKPGCSFGSDADTSPSGQSVATPNNVNLAGDNGPSAFSVDLADLASLIVSIVKG